MISNAIIYRIAPSWTASLADVEAAFAKRTFQAIGASQERSVGWVPPREESHGALVESIGGQWIAKLMIETKTVPGAVLNDEVDRLVAGIERDTGRKPGKKERKAIKEDARLALLPKAFPKRTAVHVWIDPVTRLLVIDANTQAKADDVVTELVGSLDGLMLSLLQTRQSPQHVMATWLTATDHAALPDAFMVNRECELKSSGDEPATVKFTHHNLATDEVRQHIAEGKLPTKLAMSWEGRVSFVLTYGLQIKRIKFLDVSVDASASGDAPPADAFDADVAIATGELSKLVDDLISVLGGEVEPVAEEQGAGAREVLAA